MIDVTLQSDEDDDLWGLPEQKRHKMLVKPRMTLLFHPDLARIGVATPPHVLEGEGWTTVGRTGPGFVALTPAQLGGPINDPYVSRQQFKIRWMSGEGCFEVEPVATGRRALAYIDLGANSPEAGVVPIERRMKVQPGAILAVGSRLLIHLEVTQWRPPHENRLGMVGETEALWTLRDAIVQVARLDKPALVLGPTGAGKELVARAFHGQRTDPNQTFVPINCAAVPEQISESLFFGHKKGAFTGANSDSDGYFLQAGKGTLFLDELGELPMTIQAKLLRVIQERQVTPVGARSPVDIEACLVAATNRDPEKEIAAGRLRSDFYFRIAAHTLHVPSLNDRIFDVPMLFVYFLSQHRERHPELERLWDQAAKRPVMPASFFLMLLRRSWKGNIRELQNIVEQTVRHNLQHQEGPIAIPDALRLENSRSSTAGNMTLPEPVGMVEAPKPTPSPQFSRETLLKLAGELSTSRKTLERLIVLGNAPVQGPNEEFEVFVKRIEDSVIATLEKIYSEHQGNQVQLAKFLDMSRTTLIRLLKQFGIPRA